MTISVNNNEMLVFDFDFDRNHLLAFFNEHKQHGEPYQDKRFGRFVWKSWRIVRDIEIEYADFINKHFNIDGSPRFYILDSGTILPMHIDQDTTCSLNFVLSENPAPIKFSSGNEYYYKTALLNTSIKHGVDKTSGDRVLFKLSIKDEPFDVVKQKIINTLTRS